MENVCFSLGGEIYNAVHRHELLTQITISYASMVLDRGSVELMDVQQFHSFFVRLFLSKIELYSLYTFVVLTAGTHFSLCMGPHTFLFFISVHHFTSL